MGVRSLLALADKPTSLVVDRVTQPASIDNPRGSPAAAMCGVQEPAWPSCPGPFMITVFEQHMQDLWRSSLVSGLVSLASLLYGGVAHEIGHVIGPPKFATFDVDETTSAMIQRYAVLKYLDNVVEDSAQEHRLMRSYPTLIPYVQVVLAALKWGFIEKKPGGLERDLNSIYDLVRFGVVIEGADPRLINAAWPVVRAALIGDRASRVSAAQFLFYLLVEKYGPEAKAGSGNQVIQQPMSGADMARVLEGTAVIPSSVLDTLKDINDSLEQGKATGRLAGTEGPPPSKDEHDDNFFRETVSMYIDTIEELRRVLIMSKVKIRRLYTADGDLSPKPLDQARAYVSALTGEETMSQVYNKRFYPHIQVCVLWDTSSSTTQYQNEFGHAVVTLLAAIDEQPGCSYALVTYTTTALELIPMGGELKMTTIYPRAMGGTKLGQALDIAYGYDWNARERYLVIVTDGDADDWDSQQPRIEHMRDDQHIIPILLNVEPNGHGCGAAESATWASWCQIKDMPEIVMKHIIGGDA